MVSAKDPGPTTFKMVDLNLGYSDYYEKLDNYVPTLLTAMRASVPRTNLMRYCSFIHCATHNITSDNTM